ncbi:MAG: hypothetical protein ACYDB3_05545 [Acidimicrobiales bacterium]
MANGTAGSATLWSIVLAVSVAVVLLAQFALNSWAEANQLQHQIQHGLIFMGGIGVGVSGLSLYGTGQRRADRTPR